MAGTINSIKGTLQSLVDTKMELQLELSSMNSRVRSEGRMDPFEYKRLCFKQKKTKEKMLEVEKLIGAMKCELRETSTVRPSTKPCADPSLVGSIKRIREKYLEFSKDATRVSSMRIMASNFAEELSVALGKEEMHRNLHGDNPI